MLYSTYFLAKLNRDTTWVVSGVIRNSSHIALERALVPKEDIFEFFVSPDFLKEFESLMTNLQSKGHVLWFRQEPNRFKN